MRILTVTKRMIMDGTAYAGWPDPQGIGTVGGSYKDLLLSCCDDDDPVSLVAVMEGRPVGQINFLKGFFHLQDAIVPVFWGSGFSVPLEYRNTGAGMLLLAKSRAIKPAVGAVSVSQQATPLYLKLGWTMFAFPRHVFPVRPSTYVSKRLGTGRLARCIGYISDLFAAAYRKLLLVSLDWRARKYRIIRATEISPDENVKFGAYTDRPFRTHRSAQWVNLIMSEGPTDNSRRLFSVYDANEKLVGYFIVTSALRHGAGGGQYGDLRVASIRDWVAFQPSELTDDDLILFGLRELLRTPCDVAEICIPESESGSVLRGKGMIRMGQQHFFVRFNAPFRQDSPNINAPQNWWLRPGDGDAFLL